MISILYSRLRENLYHHLIVLQRHHFSQQYLAIPPSAHILPSRFGRHVEKFWVNIIATSTLASKRPNLSKSSRAFSMQKKRSNKIPREESYCKIRLCRGLRSGAVGSSLHARLQLLTEGGRSWCLFGNIILPKIPLVTLH
jgi:hypothetical protein